MSVIGLLFATIAVHELGHMLGALAVGFRIKSIRVGRLLIEPPFRLSIHRGAGDALNGLVMVVPVTTDHLVRRAFVMVWAGPVANILSGCVVLVLPISKGLPSILFVVMSIATGLSELLPFDSKLGMSDGKRLWMLFRHPKRGETPGWQSRDWPPESSAVSFPNCGRPTFSPKPLAFATIQMTR